MTEICEKLWIGGKIIAYFCLIESILKLSFAVTELTFGHLDGAVPSETRVFIHSIIFVIIGFFGILCSTLLIIGLIKENTGKIIWWICFQGIAIFHQIFFSLEIIAIVDHIAENKVYVFIVAVVLTLFVILEGYFVKFIIGIYQDMVAAEEINSRPQQAWRIPTISELLGDECDIGESTPPIYSISSNATVRNTSDA